MVKLMAFALALCASISLAAQTTSPNPAAGPDQKSKKRKDEVTVTGCISKQNSNYILMQPDPGNTYQLEKSRKMHLATYLGREVEITGSEYPFHGHKFRLLSQIGRSKPGDHSGSLDKNHLQALWGGLINLAENPAKGLAVRVIESAGMV